MFPLLAAIRRWLAVLLLRSLQVPSDWICPRAPRALRDMPRTPQLSCNRDYRFTASFARLLTQLFVWLFTCIFNCTFTRFAVAIGIPS